MMTKLIEVKASCHHDAQAMRNRLNGLATAAPTDLQQDDTFFVCAKGRPKLRELSPDRGGSSSMSGVMAPGPSRPISW